MIVLATYTQQSSGKNSETLNEIALKKKSFKNLSFGVDLQNSRACHPWRWEKTGCNPD